MNETRNANDQAGPRPTYRTRCNYQVVWRGETENCLGEFSVEAPDALTAATEALALVKAMAGKHQVTNLVLQVSLAL